MESFAILVIYIYIISVCILAYTVLAWLYPQVLVNIHRVISIRDNKSHFFPVSNPVWVQVRYTYLKIAKRMLSNHALHSEGNPAPLYSPLTKNWQNSRRHIQILYRINKLLLQCLYRKSLVNWINCIRIVSVQYNLPPLARHLGQPDKQPASSYK